MANYCAITKKGTMVGGGYSNRTRATKFNPTGKVRKFPNLQKKKVYIPELKKSISIRVSTKGFRTLTKNGAYVTLKKAGLLRGLYDKNDNGTKSTPTPRQLKNTAKTPEVATAE